MRRMKQFLGEIIEETPRRTPGEAPEGIHGDIPSILPRPPGTIASESPGKYSSNI